MTEQKIAPVLSDDEAKVTIARAGLGYGESLCELVREVEQAVLAKQGAVRDQALRHAEADGFAEWFAAIWAGSDDVPVPEYQSAEWHKYMEHRTLARGAWNEAWYQATHPAIRALKVTPAAAVDAQPMAQYRLFMDGDQWCCAGVEFANLQESDAGFGATARDALENYEQIIGDRKRAAMRANNWKVPIAAQPSAQAQPSGNAGELDLSQWKKARFGYFKADGSFHEMTDADHDEWPADCRNPRWVGGHNDMQLLRAAIAASKEGAKL